MTHGMRCEPVEHSRLVAFADVLLADPQGGAIFRDKGVYLNFSEEDWAVLYPLLDAHEDILEVARPSPENIRASIALARRVGAGIVKDEPSSKLAFISDRYFTPRVEPEFAHQKEKFDPAYHRTPKVSDLIDILRGLETQEDVLAPYRSVKENGTRGKTGNYFASHEDSGMYGVKIYSAVIAEISKHALFNRWQVPLLESQSAVDMWTNPFKPELVHLYDPAILKFIVNICKRRGPVEIDEEIAS